MKKNKNKKWGRRVFVTLSDTDIDALRRYAEAQGQAPAVAIRQILRQHLAGYFSSSGSSQPDNQLNIFDAMQYDIFDNMARVAEDE